MLHPKCVGRRWLGLLLLLGKVVGRADRGDQHLCQCILGRGTLDEGIRCLWESCFATVGDLPLVLLLIVFVPWCWCLLRVQVECRVDGHRLLVSPLNFIVFQEEYNCSLLQLSLMS